jgi:hypothetical protein
LFEDLESIINEHWRDNVFHLTLQPVTYEPVDLPILVHASSHLSFVLCLDDVGYRSNYMAFVENNSPSFASQSIILIWTNTRQHNDNHSRFPVFSYLIMLGISGLKNNLSPIFYE